MTKMIKLLHCSISSFTIRKTTSYYEMISFKAVTLRLEVFVTESSYFDGLYSKVPGPSKNGVYSEAKRNIENRLH